MATRLKWVVCLLVVAMVGCTSTAGRKFDIHAARQIKEGTSTKADVERLLGQPYGTNRLVDGTENWTYTYITVTQAGALTVLGLAGSKSSRDNLAITFRNGIVSKCVLMTSAGEGRGMEGMYQGEGMGGPGRSSTVACSELGR